MNRIKVSVIIPAYNCADSISKSIDSALAQNVPLEVIVLNDCSKDHLDDVMQKYQENDEVRYIKNQQNIGAAQTRNKGVSLAKGEYVAFLDGDDYWEEHKLDKQIKLIEETNTVLCSTARELLTPEGECTGRVIPVKPIITYKELLKHNSINCSSVLVRTEVAKEFPMHHEDSHEDYIMWLEILKKYGKACAVNEPLLKYRLSNQGKSGSKLNSAKMTFKVYRYMGFGMIQSITCFGSYVLHGVRKYYLNKNVKCVEKKVRVLVVLDYINSNSGVSSVVMNYYANIDSSKVQMDFLLYENPEANILSQLSNKGSRVYALGHPLKNGLSKYQKAIADFFKEHQNEYQIVHVHIPNAAFIVLKYAKKYGVKNRIIHSHNSRGADGIVKKIRNYVLNKQGIRYATQYFACSKSAGEYLYGKKYLEKVLVINNAINLEKYRYAQESSKKIKEELCIGDELVLGHVGRFSRQKNHAFLIEIAKQLKERNVSFKLILLGDGELQKEIKKQVEVLELNKQVLFVGVVDNVKEYMDAMDLFILPSFYEGLPCVCIEAQANNLPCLISENITKEVAFNNSVQFLGITDAEKWVNTILKYDIQRLRHQRENYDCIDLKDYDIVTQAKTLEEKYLSYGNSSDINVDL